MVSDQVSATLKFWDHQLQPEDLLHFIELKPFSRRWKHLKQSDESLHALQIILMAEPNAGKVIQGTGGLRKVRFSPPDWPTGRSNALRVCYVYYDEFKIILLVTVYAKNEQHDLTEEQKHAIKVQIDRQKTALHNGTYS
jgi:hypothetical protein